MRGSFTTARSQNIYGMAHSKINHLKSQKFGELFTENSDLLMVSVRCENNAPSQALRLRRDPSPEAGARSHAEPRGRVALGVRGLRGAGAGPCPWTVVGRD